MISEEDVETVANLINVLQGEYLAVIREIDRL